MDPEIEIKLGKIGSFSPSLKTKLNELVFLGSGSAHAVFQVKDRNGLVLIFKREQPWVIGQLEQRAELIFEQIYEATINKLFPALDDYRCEKQISQILNNGNQFNFICQSLEERVKNSGNQFYVPKKAEFRISKKYRKIYLSRNIFEQKFNVIVELKPKSIVPEGYPRKTLEQVAKEVGKTMKEVIQLLKSADPVQKLRWWKVSEPLNKQRSLKIHINPLVTYNVVQSSSVPQFTSSKCFKKLPLNCEDQLEELNKTIFTTLHRDKNLLTTVLSLHELFPYSTEMIDPNSLNLSSIQLQPLKNQLETVIKAILATQLKIPMSQYLEYLKEFNCVAEEKPFKCSAQCQLLLYLIARTWRDVSFVFLASFDGNGFQETKICIIDDYLKSCWKLEANIEKDVKLIKKYVKDKLESKPEPK